MASLLDPLPDDMLRLLRTAADGYAAADGRWPCWQWVRQQLWTHDGLDAEEILGGMPTWEHDYRPVRLGYRGHPIPKITDDVPLSIHGMANVGAAVPAVQQLVSAFLAALRTAAVMQRGIKPEPTRTVELKVPGDDFTRTVNMAAGTELSAGQLFSVLSGEPATWLGVNQQNDQWTWDLTNARLTPYAQVKTIDDYLVRLDALIAVPQQAALPDYLPRWPCRRRSTTLAWPGGSPPANASSAFRGPSYRPSSPSPRPAPKSSSPGAALSATC